ncbi:hypothetical protein TrCOL_g10914 [Triparma columacea]|uniref:Uncharacterized protein n=1 Tax=Triparma columacea TaxID=722753 RepID=A0A9W7L4G3_9STRA|nr:hypothetical protein TrCOL_g10914 [Triparma columacea]
MDVIPQDLLLEVKEMTILELCEVDQKMAMLAFRALDNGENIFSGEARVRVDRALMSASSVSYGSNNGVTKQGRRDAIGKKLEKYIPTAPSDRLTALITQALQWQRHTGTLPLTDPSEHDDPSVIVPASFDLVTGLPPSFATEVPENLTKMSDVDVVPSQQYGVVKFSKKTHAETVSFLPDGSGILTGSTDGFVEVWNHTTCKLRTEDLAYQANDEIMLHDTNVLSVCSSPDGTMLGTGDSAGCVKVWGLMSGKCVRKFQEAHTKGVLSLAFVKDGSKILSGSQDGLIREFGLRSAKMTQEFRGHGSYVTSIALVKNDSMLVSSSADATVKVWHCGTGDCLQTLTLPSVSGSAANAISINDVLPLDSDGSVLILVPKGPKAYLMGREKGDVVREFKAERGDFVCGCLSPRGKFFYAVSSEGTSNLLHCFDVASGATEKVIEVCDFDVLGITHHPNKNILATWANEGNRGKVKLWVPEN